MKHSLLKRIVALAIVWAMVMPMLAFGEEIEPAVEISSVVPIETNSPETAPDEENIEAPVAETDKIELGNMVQMPNTDDDTENTLLNDGVVATESFEETFDGDDALFASGSNTLTLKKGKKTYQETMYVGEKLTVKPVSGSKFKSCTSSNKNRATVKKSSSGKTCTVTAKKAGTVKITLKIGNTKYTVNVTVKASISFSESEIMLGVGDELDLMDYIEIQPTNAITNYTWQSSSTSRVKVDNDGVIVAKKKGTATVKVTTDNNKSAIITINVVPNKIDNLNENPKSKQIKALKGAWTLWPKSVEKTSNGSIICEFYLLNATGYKASYIKDLYLSLAIGDSGNVIAQYRFKKISKTCANNKYVVATATFPASAVENNNVFLPDCDVEDIIFDLTDGKLPKLKHSKGYGKYIPTEFPEESIVPVTGITVSPDSRELSVGDTLKLTAKVEPEDATNSEVVWSSDDNSIATVDKNGTIKALSFGKAIITATAVDGSGVQGEAEVIMYPDFPEITECEAGENSVYIAWNKVKDVSEYTVTYSTSDLDDPETYENGLAYSLSVADPECFLDGLESDTEYNIEICAEAPGVGAVTAVMVRTANTQGDDDNILVTGVTMDHDDVYLSTGETMVLTAEVEPENATNKELNWSSSDESVASVDEHGTVTVLGLGKAVITAAATDGSGIEGSTVVYNFPDCPEIIQCTSGATDIQIVWNEVDGATGYTVHYSMYDLSDQETFDNDLVNFVSADKAECNISGLEENTLYYIDVYAEAPGVAAVTSLTIQTGDTQPESISVTGISLNTTFEYLNVGESYKLDAQILPENATDQVVMWSVDNPSVVSVSGDGNVTGLSAGQAIVTAKTHDGNYTASAEFDVYITAPEIVTLTSGIYTIDVEWNEVQGAAGYYVRYGTSSKMSQNSGVWVGGQSSTKTTISGLNPETLYYVDVISCVNKAEIDQGMVSKEKSVKTLEGPKPVVVLTPPEIGSVTANSETSLTVTWQPATGHEGYTILCNTTKSESGAKKVYAGADETSKQITGLSDGETYYVCVRATGKNQEYKDSAWKSVKLLPLPPVKPNPPTNVSANATARKSIKVTWTKSTSNNVTGYNVYYGTSVSQSNAKLYDTYASSKAAATITGLDEGKLYYVWVKTLSNGTESDFSMSDYAVTYGRYGSFSTNTITVQQGKKTSVKISGGVYGSTIDKVTVNGKGPDGKTITAYTNDNWGNKTSFSKEEMQIDATESGKFSKPGTYNLRLWVREKGTASLGDYDNVDSLTVVVNGVVPPRKVSLTVKAGSSSGSKISNKQIIEWPKDQEFKAVCSQTGGNGKYLTKAYVMSSAPAFTSNEVSKIVTGVGYNGTGYYYGSTGKDEFGQSTMNALPFNVSECKVGQYVKIWIAAEDANYSKNGELDQIQFALKLVGSTAYDPALPIPSLSGSKQNTIIQVAESQIGYTERGDNHSVYGAFTGTDGHPWCAPFVSWCASKAELSSVFITSGTYADPDDLLRKGYTAWYFKTYKNYDITKCMSDASVKTYDPNRTSVKPEKGDLIFFEKTDGSCWAHVGIITDYNNNTKIITYIDGNGTNEGGTLIKGKSGHVAVSKWEIPLKANLICAIARPKY